MSRGLFFSDYEIEMNFKRVGAPSPKQMWSCLPVYLETTIHCTLMPSLLKRRHLDSAWHMASTFVTSISTGLAQTLGIFEGTTLALMEQTFVYKAPTFFGDTIHLKLIVDATRPSSKGGKGVVTFRSEVIKQDGTVVNEAQMGGDVSRPLSSIIVKRKSMGLFHSLNTQVAQHIRL